MNTYPQQIPAFSDSAGPPKNSVDWTGIGLHDLFKHKLQWSFRAKYRPGSREGIVPALGYVVI